MPLYLVIGCTVLHSSCLTDNLKDSASCKVNLYSEHGSRPVKKYYYCRIYAKLSENCPTAKFNGKFKE